MAEKRALRRAPGEVRDAIVAVLSDGRRPMHVREIHEAVERRLGGAVPTSSVRSYLQLGTDAVQPLFSRVAHGQYKLVRRK
jgi:hypothetical protein